jgi:3-oxoacyl-[acyl-carrier-protein] synthase III
VNTSIHLAGVSHRHGTWRDLDALITSGAADATTVKRLRDGGLTRYSVLEDHPRTLYDTCLAETLDRTGTKAQDVDAMLFFSSTFAPYEDHADLPALCTRFGMRDLFPVGVFLGQCSNFSSALLVASGLITTQGLDNVILLGADALDESHSERVMPGDVSVMSDTVLTAFVSRDETDGYRVDRVEHRFAPELQPLHPSKDVLRYLDGYTRALKDVTSALFESNGRATADYRRLVLANLARPVLRNIADVLDVPFDHVPIEGVASLGHCFAYDQLITLSHLVEDTAPGDPLLVVGVGANYLYSATALTRCAPGR